MTFSSSLTIWVNVTNTGITRGGHNYDAHNETCPASMLFGFVIRYELMEILRETEALRMVVPWNSLAPAWSCMAW